MHWTVGTLYTIITAWFPMHSFGLKSNTCQHAYLKWCLLLFCSNAEVQCDVAMLCLSRVRVKDKGLLLSRVRDRAKWVKQPSHKVISSLDRPFSDESIYTQTTTVASFGVVKTTYCRVVSTITHNACTVQKGSTNYLNPAWIGKGKGSQ